MNRRCAARRRVRAQRWYRRIVRLYPAPHRNAFGDEMVQAFGDHYRDTVGSGRVGRWRFWRSVFADAGRSLVVEHAAAIRARGAGARARPARPACPSRRTRIRRRLRRLLRPAHRPVRVLARTGRHQLVYRGRIAALVMLAALVGAALTTGTVLGHMWATAAVAGLVVTAWLAYKMRLTRLVPAGRRGNGPAPPGGASMREPRRPLPMSPAGSAARPRDAA